MYLFIVVFYIFFGTFLYLLMPDHHCFFTCSENRNLLSIVLKFPLISGRLQPTAFGARTTAPTPPPTPTTTCSQTAASRLPPPMTTSTGTHSLQLHRDYDKRLQNKSRSGHEERVLATQKCLAAGGNGRAFDARYLIDF